METVIMNMSNYNVDAISLGVTLSNFPYKIHREIFSLKQDKHTTRSCHLLREFPGCYNGI